MKATRRRRTDGHIVLTAMVTDRHVLGQVAQQWGGKMFDSPEENVLAGWCVSHYRKFHEAPGLVIRNYYDEWAERADGAASSRVADYLDEMSRDYERNGHSPSSEYLLDVAGKFFNRVKMRAALREVEGHLDLGDVDAADRALRSYRQVELGTGAYFDVFDDDAGLEADFASTDGKNLIRFHGEQLQAIDSFFSHTLTRDSFVAFMGKEKVGKSFWLLDLAYRAMTQGKKVAYFEVGDLSRAQLRMRFAVRAARHPRRVPLGSVLRVPKALIPSEGKHPEVESVETRFDADLSQRQAKAAFNKVVRKRTGGSNVRVSVHPNSSVSMAGIHTLIEGWASADWVPDVVVIDYADILKPMDGRADTRDQINASWKAMRRLSQQFHCLVLTATQSDADSYDATTLARHNFSDDKRKYAHVTAMVGINQDNTEKPKGLYRLNWILGRELEAVFTEGKALHCAGCLALASPVLASLYEA